MEMLPNDVRQHRFGKSVRGYSVDEVDQFLEQVATVLEDALEARQRAEETAHRIERDMERYRDQEGALKKAVLTVENAMESAKLGAMRDVEAIKRDAEARARQIVHEAELESRKLEQDMKFLRDTRQGMLEQIRGFCKAQLATLEAMERPERTREASRQAVMPRATEPPSPRPMAPAPMQERQAPPATSEPQARTTRAWQPEKVERDEVDARISEALGVDEPGVAFPPPLVPYSRPQGDR